KVIEGRPADRAGLQKGDRLVSVNGQEIDTLGQLMNVIATSPGKECLLVVIRGEKEATLKVTPEFNADAKKGMIGVQFDFDTVLIHPNPIKQITEVLLQMARIVSAIFHQKETGIGVKDLSGPIGIIDHLYKAVASDIRYALYFLVLLNVNLAVLN